MQRHTKGLFGLSIAWLVVCLFGTNAVVAQTGTTAINGNVSDQQGSSVAGATVTLTLAGTESARTIETDSSGHYQFQALPPGVYSVKVEMTGFRSIVREKVELLVATDRKLDFQLELGEVNQSIVVSEAPPALNTQDATVGNAFNEQEVKELPFLARNVVNLLTLQPGVVFTGNSDTDRLSQGDISTLDGREGVVNGVRGNQTNVTLDGVDANDWQNQAAFTSALPVTLDSVQEFRVTTANANATEGVASGAQVALVTKSGTNEFHGNLRWYYRTSGATANSFFNKAQPVEIGRPKLQRNIGGGSLGGPIKKDRLFLFLDYETRREASSFSVVPREVPSDALKAGVLLYACKGTDTEMPEQVCPGGNTVAGLNGTTFTVPKGAFGLTPAQFQSIDSAGIGVNSAMIAYMAQLPSGNAPVQGLDNVSGQPLAFNGLIFNAPEGTTNNVYTARMDYNITRDGHQAVYVRGVLGGLKTDLIEANFPGEAPTSTLLNNSRGIAVSYTYQIRPTLINSLHYGFTRLGVSQSGAQGPLFNVRSFTNIENFSRAFGHQVPVHEIRDDVIWTHGRHTIQAGGTLRYIRNHRQDETLSFPNFVVNNGFCVALCRDAANALGNGNNFPEAGNLTLFTRAAMALTGSVTQVNTNFFNGDPKTGSVLPQGSTELREFAQNDYELYAEDSWRIRNNVTLTLGLRYQYSTPPWEVNGFQSAVNLDIHQWLVQREINQAAGIPSDASPLLSWDLAGSANGKPSWFRPNKKDFAPRLALAWSPGYQDGLLKALFGGPGKSSLRLGAGMFYDRLGQAMAAETDLNGSPGIGTPLINSSTQFTFATAPRFSGSCTFSGCTGLPSLDQFFAPITSVSFPFTPQADTSNLGFVIDNHLKTPYTIDLNVSYQRDLGKGVVLDVAYLGTMGRRLLAKADYGQYLNIKDPTSKTTLFQAYSQLVKLAGQTPGQFNGNANIDPLNIAQLQTIKSIPFFDNLMQNMPAFTAGWYGDSSFSNLTPTQAFYAYAVGSWTPSWSCALFAMDTVTTPTSFAFGLPTPWNSSIDPQGDGFVLFTPQFSSLPGWTNFGNSNYNSLQVSIRKTTGPVIYGLNYVYSKGIDNTSGTENQDNVPNVNLTNGTLNGLIQNPFDLRANRAPSDFDLRHNVNGFWLADLPFGTGKKFGNGAGRLLDAVIGGWQWSGTLRIHSGFPLSPSNGFNFPTNFFLTSAGTLQQSVSTSLGRCRGSGDGSTGCFPNLFADPASVVNLIAPTLPGGDGSRNVFRGPAYFATDMGVYKSFKMPWNEARQRLQFRVTAFNVFNTVNFSDVFLSLDPTSPSTFGQPTSTAGPRGGQREMEFAIRYEF